jgi:hypothetical protein
MLYMCHICDTFYTSHTVCTLYKLYVCLRKEMYVEIYVHYIHMRIQHHFSRGLCGHIYLYIYTQKTCHSY